MKVLHVVGARPNFMKIAPIIEAFSKHNRQCPPSRVVEQVLVHTGQHYDHAMSQMFFDELEIPRPDINLEVGSGSHGEQTGRIMEAFEKVLASERPDLVLVVGDVNSTMACTIDAKKMGIAVAHVEAGLRSRDMGMPEEINRLVTDAIADLLFTTDPIADENLRREGVADEKIFFVGNVMIDTLMKHRAKALQLPTLRDLGLSDGARTKPYAVVTLHRPSNVEDPATLRSLGEVLSALGRKMPIVFPVHPRTRGRIKEFGLDEHFSSNHQVQLLDPMGYLDFLNLLANARLILTDSGGIQEESTILSVPCLTLRPNTERPITIEQGTNRLVGNRKEDVLSAIDDILGQPTGAVRVPELWDGNAAIRIVEIIMQWFVSATAEREAVSPISSQCHQTKTESP